MYKWHQHPLNCSARKRRSHPWCSSFLYWSTIQCFNKPCWFNLQNRYQSHPFVFISIAATLGQANNISLLDCFLTDLCVCFLPSITSSQKTTRLIFLKYKSDHDTSLLPRNFDEILFTVTYKVLHDLSPAPFLTPSHFILSHMDYTTLASFRPLHILIYLEYFSSTESQLSRVVKSKNSRVKLVSNPSCATY